MGAKKQQEQCPICLGKIILKNKIKLECNHYFCRDCIKQWYSKSQVGSKITILPVEDCSEF